MQASYIQQQHLQRPAHAHHCSLQVTAAYSAKFHMGSLTVGVEHFGNEAHSGGLVWVVLCKLQCQLEGTCTVRVQSIQ